MGFSRQDYWSWLPFPSPEDLPNPGIEPYISCIAGGGVTFPYLESVRCFMSCSNCCFLTCIRVSQEVGKVIWYSHLFKNFWQFVVIHTVKSFGIVNKAEVDVFLELSCFFDEPTDVGSLISGSSAFSKPSWNIWKFIVHVLLKPSLENFEHYFATAWDECNCVVFEHSLAIQTTAQLHSS